MSAASTSAIPVQVSDFEWLSPLVHRVCLIYGCCSSNQRFAFGFLQIPPHEGHPCRLAIRFPLSGPFRTKRFLAAPVGRDALPGALTYHRHSRWLEEAPLKGAIKTSSRLDSLFPAPDSQDSLDFLYTLVFALH